MGVDEDKAAEKAAAEMLAKHTAEQSKFWVTVKRGREVLEVHQTALGNYLQLGYIQLED